MKERLVLPLDGYLWLKTAFDHLHEKVVQDGIDRNLHLDKSGNWQKRWENITALHLCQALYNGRLKGFYSTDTEFVSIFRGVWRNEKGLSLIKAGIISTQDPENPDELIMLEETTYTEFVDWFLKEKTYKSAMVSNAYIHSAAGKAPLPPRQFTTPFVDLIIAAINHFQITEDSAPTKDELKHWFSQQKLPGGEDISPNLSEHLATFSRPPHMRKGGYFKPRSQ